MVFETSKMRTLLILCMLPLIEMFLMNTNANTNKYIDTLKKPAKPVYLNELNGRRKQFKWKHDDRRVKKNSVDKEDVDSNQKPVFMNATFVINQIGSRGLFLRNNEDDEKYSKKEVSSSNGNFYLQDVKQYNFTSIGGYTNIKRELMQMLDMIQYPGNYSQYNVRLPKGILLYGPPGNGKTLLARCFAGESGLSIIATSGSEFQEKYVGTGPARIRELFEFARDNTPCMIFIDEIDAVARKRGSDGEAAQAERDSTLNQLLVELDGFGSFLDKKIFVMASTNRIDIIDPAMLRPGRIDKKIQVPIPDKDTRKEILKIHLDKKPIESNFEWMVDELTEGMSGAEIEHILNEATLLAIRKNSIPVKSEDLESVREMNIVGAGAHQMPPMTGELALRVAVHELGHAIVAINSINHDNPKKCTIVVTNKMLGYTLFPPQNSTLMTLNSLSDRIKVLLGGRIAEELIFGPESISTGAADDLQKCQQLAHDMTLLYGMGTQLIYPRLSDNSKKEIDDAVFNIIRKNYVEAKAILRENQDVLVQIAAELVKKQTLTFQEIIEFLP